MDYMDYIKDRKFGLIARELGEIVVEINGKQNEGDVDFEKTFDDAMGVGLFIVRNIFQGKTILKKRREDNKVYYAFTMEDTLIFECGFEVEDETE